MDIARPDIARKKRLRRGLYSVSATVVLVLITIGVSRLEPAAPSVDFETVFLDTVERGDFVRSVRGTGELVPEEIRWIPATTVGNVERIVLDPGDDVTPDSIIIELSNPELAQTLLEAELQLREAEAGYTSRQAELRSQLLGQRSSLATIEAGLTQARLKAEANQRLADAGLLSDLDLKQSLATEQELETRFGLEQERFESDTVVLDAQLAVEQAKVDRLRTLWELRQQQVADLHVRAGIHGILQQVLIQEGARVAAGDNLARGGDPSVLKAQLRIAETQARDIQEGQMASIDTRNGIIPGHVVRIDPAVENGTVTVDVTLDGPLPRGARPDLTVDGTIELERLEDVIFVTKPVFGQEQSVVSLFRFDPDRGEATRTRVGLGRGSVSVIEILEGLQPGDQVILSDMSAWDAFDRVRLN